VIIHNKIGVINHLVDIIRRRELEYLVLSPFIGDGLDGNESWGYNLLIDKEIDCG
jgi:hypothetical protein